MTSATVLFKTPNPSSSNVLLNSIHNQLFKLRTSRESFLSDCVKKLKLLASSQIAVVALKMVIQLRFD